MLISHQPRQSDQIAHPIGYLYVEVNRGEFVRMQGFVHVTYASLLNKYRTNAADSKPTCVQRLHCGLL
jgi:hypothetical protein